MNGLICSLLYRFTPDELRMILVDPKFIEFRSYQDIPHLLLPVVDDPGQAGTALKWAVREMERRYKILAKIGARNLASFNQKVEEMGAEVVRDLLCAEENQEEDDSASARAGGSQDWMEAFEPDESGAPRVGQASLHRDHHRRAGRSHDGRQEGGRDLDRPHRAESARGRAFIS